MREALFYKITRVTPYLISAASLIFAAQFLFETIQSSLFNTNAVWIGIVIFLSLCTIIGLRDEFKFVRQIKLSSEDFLFADLIKSMLVVILNVMATHLVAVYFQTTTIFAASLVCVISAYTIPSRQPEAYSGSCGGMIGAYLSSHWSIALLVGIMTGLVYILFKPYFLGVGGRGGSLPYTATILTIRLILDVTPESSTPIHSDLIAPAFVTLIAVAFLTYLLHKNNILSVVKAAMVVSLVLTLLIPLNYYSITTAMFAGTIVGMTLEERLDGYLHLLVICLICFLLFVPSFHILDGIGGKLGMLCLVSYYSSNGLKIVIQYFQHLLTKLTEILSI